MAALDFSRGGYPGEGAREIVHDANRLKFWPVLTNSKQKSGKGGVRLYGLAAKNQRNVSGDHCF